jgi:hypothetical protein
MIEFYPPRLEPEFVLLSLGVKAAVKKERVLVTDVPTWCSWAATRGWRAIWDPRYTYDAQHTDGHDYSGTSMTTVFLAKENGPAQRLLELSRVERDGRDGDIVLDEAVRDIGELLGYPPCCVDSFRANNNSKLSIRSRSGLHLDPYYATVGPFDSRINRFNTSLRLYSHRPCTQRCLATTRIVERVYDYLEAHVPTLVQTCKEEQRRPVLYWDSDHFVSFDGHIERNRLVYRNVIPSRPLVRGLSLFPAALALLRRGNVVTWRPGCVSVFDQEQMIGEIADLDALSLPHMFVFDGEEHPFSNSNRIALLSTPQAPLPEGVVLNLVGDLGRQGVDVSRVTCTQSEIEDESVLSRKLEQCNATWVLTSGTTLTDVPVPTATIAWSEAEDELVRRRENLTSAMRPLFSRGSPFFADTPPQPGVRVSNWVGVLTADVLPSDAPRPVSGGPRALRLDTFGPLHRGATLVDNWSIDTLEIRNERIRVGLRHHTNHEVWFQVGTEACETPPGPFDMGAVRLPYDKTRIPVAAFEGAGRRLASILNAAVGDRDIGDAFAEWRSLGGV